jgi:hypothetical protein
MSPTQTKRKKLRRIVNYRLQRQAAELSVLALTRDINDVIKLHVTNLTQRHAAATRQRGQRTEHELEILSLARVLEILAAQYPVFGDELRKLQCYVRRQLTQPKARRAELVAKVGAEEPIEKDELIKATPYPPPVVRSDIQALVKAKRISEVNRDGRPARAIDRRYLILAGPSQQLPRNG